MYHQKIPGTDTNSTAAATSTTAAPDKGVLLALEAGWTVALLYGLPQRNPSPGEDHLLMPRWCWLAETSACRQNTNCRTTYESNLKAAYGQSA